MSRIIVLLDVTAMSGEAVCVAGLDIDTGETLRLNHPQPTRTILERFGGLAPGDVIEVDWQPVQKAAPPHVEDGIWKPITLEKLRKLAFAELVGLLADHACPSVEAAFGERSYKSSGGNHAWEPGQGMRSLATLRVRYVRTELRGDKPRIAIRDHADAYWGAIPFQDLIVRSHAGGCSGCGDAYLSRVRDEFDGSGVLVRVGLTRPFAPDDSRGEACWLQVTNVFARPRQHFT